MNLHGKISPAYKTTTVVTTSAGWYDITMCQNCKKKVWNSDGADTKNVGYEYFSDNKRWDSDKIG